jgi:hypothetical protein
MPHYSAVIRSVSDPASTFAYLSRFDRAVEWDPGVAEAEMLTAEPVGRGSRFRLVARFLGRSVPLEYEIVEFRSPERLVLNAETNLISSTDTITFDPDGSGTVVAYDALLEGKGLARLADPLLAIAFRRIGDRAVAGLRTRLSQGVSP